MLTASCVTSLPVGRRTGSSANLGGLSKYLPAVGLFVGAIVGLTAWCCYLLGAPHLVTGVCVTLCWLCISGGIHLDGLMDTADGVFSHRSRHRMLEIMHDSRVGNFGVMAGVGVVLIKFACLSNMHLSAILATSIVVPAWARWTETLTIGRFPYLRAQGMGKIWHDTTRFPRDILVSLVVPLTATAICASFFGTSWAVVLSLSTVLLGYLAASRISAVLGGQTGDTYGAVVEIAECGGLLLSLLLLSDFQL